MTHQNENTDADLPRLPPRKADSHKGNYGRALLIGGSRGMSGAIVLAGISALRGGAGLVTLAVPDSCVETIAAHEPSYMTRALPESKEGRIAAAAGKILLAQQERFTAIALGPGMGRSPDLDALVSRLYSTIDRPLVLDADALNALADHPDALAAPPPATRIFTPHPGEFARLLGVSKLDEDSTRQAQEFAAKHGVVLVLKGHKTLVTDGASTWHNSTGNPGMATGGSGDVLTGLVTALLCQRMSPLDSARLGVHIHGLAGDLAAEELGQTSLIASDLPRYFGAAFKRVSPHH